MNLSGSSKRVGGCIFESCDISLENMPTLHAVSLALFMYTSSYFSMRFCHALMQMVSAFIC